MGRGGLTHVLLDTHVWAWSLTSDKRLSSRALEVIETADTVSISAISLYEIGQKVRLGKWPEMVPYHFELADLAMLQGSRVLALSAKASLAASILDWQHRDPFDRIIGATALVEGLTLISADVVFDELSQFDNWPGRVW